MDNKEVEKSKARKLWGKFWNCLSLFIKRVYKYFLLALILGLVWFGFLRLVSVPPLDTTPVLIMVWGTAIILIIVLFPSFLDAIKRIKVGDVEVELKDTVKTSAAVDYISIQNLSGQSISEAKGDTDNLKRLIGRILLEREKPVLLTVNLNSQDWISKSFLYVYLYLMNLYCNLIIVVFVSQKVGYKGISSLDKSDVIGVISGQDLLREYYRRFPSLIGANPPRDWIEGNLFELYGVVTTPSSLFLEYFYNRVHTSLIEQIQSEIGNALDNRPFDPNRIDRLSKKEVTEWLGNKLDNLFVEKDISPRDYPNLKQSFAKNDEFLIVTKNSMIEKIVTLDNLAREFTIKILDQTKE